MALTNIANRLTPSTPLEITFGAQPTATGRKLTTIFGHRAATGGSGADYLVHEMISVGDPDLAKTEVDALAGTGSEIGKMAYAFVKSNSAPGRSNFPAFRIVLLPYAQTGFGPTDEAILAVKLLRSDALVTPYDASGGTNLTKMSDLAALISGPDRDLNGQFGTFVHAASLTASATALAINKDNKFVCIEWLQDTGVVVSTGDTLIGSPVVSSIPPADLMKIVVGMVVTGAGIPAATTVLSKAGSTLTLSNDATATATGVALTFTAPASQSVGEVAAAACAAKMGLVFPYLPAENLELGGMLPPVISSERITVGPTDLSETALVAGLSPIKVDSAGRCRLLRTRTTRVTTDGSTPATAYFDWQDLVVLNDFREDVYNRLQSPDLKPKKASIETAGFVKDEILRIALDYQEAGAFQKVKELAKFFVVQPSASSRGRFDFKIPVNVVPGLMVVAGNIEATTLFDSFTL